MRFLHSAPHFVRRSSRNDSELFCHPERSASGVEGSHSIRFVLKELDRIYRMEQDELKNLVY